MWVPGLADRFKGGLTSRGVDYARARDVQREWIACLERVLGDDGILVVPGTPVTASTIGDREGGPIARVMTRFTAMFNLAGVPVLSVPVGKIGALPVGMQLVAGPGRESILKGVASEARSLPL